MQVLSVAPEWAYAIMFADPPKDVECRTWWTAHRGLLGVQASTSPDPEARPFLAGLGIKVPGEFTQPVGMILGTVNVDDVVRDSKSVYADPGVWHWLLSGREPWPQPVKARGWPGLWPWPARPGHPGSLQPATRVSWHVSAPETMVALPPAATSWSDATGQVPGDSGCRA